MPLAPPGDCQTRLTWWAPTSATRTDVTLPIPTRTGIKHFLINEKALRETQTLRAGCSKAEPTIFAPPQTPFPGALDGQNLISWRRSLPLPTNPVWWGSMHAILSYRGNRPTNTHTNTRTHRQDRLQYTAPQLAHSETSKFRMHGASVYRRSSSSSSSSSLNIGRAPITSKNTSA